jgi:formate hydrogenlyase subunit 4
MTSFLCILAFLFLAPLAGGLLAGLDRIISARMQGRVGPPVVQPFYDVLKLLEKESIVVRRSQNFYIFFFLLFIIFTGCLFFGGGDLLLFIFALTLAGVFFVLGAYKTSSPYSFIGAERELIQMMAYEPIVILVAVGMYMVTKSFYISDILSSGSSMIFKLPGVFLAFLYILTIKLRKSPFDLSVSHHAHQELVKGAVTEFSGSTLAMIEIAHWYENIFIMGLVYLFFAGSPVLGIFITLLTYFFEILIDNTFARVKWQLTLKSSWIMTIVFGFGNILVLTLLR